MKKLIWVLLIALPILGCQENESGKDDFTGNETVYALQPGSDYNINGTVTFKEREDGSALVTVALSGTEGNTQHPVHLHLGDISTPGAEVYALLNPVTGKSGVSETVLSYLADESPVNYKQLINLNACLKVHLAAAGPDRDIILAGGNIGKEGNNIANGRTGFGVCKSE